MRISSGVAVTSCGLLFLSGCSGVPVTSKSVASPSAVQGSAITGRVHGGQSVIAGAHLYLYAANNSALAGPGIAASNGNQSVSLLNSSGANTQADGSGNYYVTTDSNGLFSITGDYTCPSTASQLYLYSVGGNPGAGANSAAGLLAALGACPASGTLSSSLYVVINEVSTIAMAYAVSGYATDATHVSSSGSTLALTGIANAFLTAQNLAVDTGLSAGVSLATTPAGNGIVPQAEIDTLANILAACVSSTGPGSSTCNTLFTNAKNGSTEPADTATAAINFAHNPAANVASLYGLQTANTSFQPMLTAAPANFVVAINYTGGGFPLQSAWPLTFRQSLGLRKCPATASANSVLSARHSLLPSAASTAAV